MLIFQMMTKFQEGNLHLNNKKSPDLVLAKKSSKVGELFHFINFKKK